MYRIKINLLRLPNLVKYAIALPTAAIIIAIAWTFHRQAPGPAWISVYLLPAWRWLGVAVLFGFIILYLFKKARDLFRSKTGRAPPWKTLR